MLALKGNQGNLRDEVGEAFTTFDAKKTAVVDKSEQIDHGRIEERICYVALAKDYLSPAVLSQWKELKTIIKILELADRFRTKVNLLRRDNCLRFG